jgi:hypothetical protein
MFNTPMPQVRFRAGDDRTLYTNVNFARDVAQGLANTSGVPVPIHHVVNGKQGMILHDVHPEKGEQNVVSFFGRVAEKLRRG